MIQREETFGAKLVKFLELELLTIPKGWTIVRATSFFTCTASLAALILVISVETFGLLSGSYSLLVSFPQTS